MYWREGDGVLMKNYNKTIFPYYSPGGRLQIREFDNELYGIDGATAISYQAMVSEFKKTSFSWDRLSEIKKCLDVGMLHSALILALTIPDICGRVEYPDIPDDKNNTRYRKWFDDCITKYNIGEVGENKDTFDCFNGYMCYLLRCRMLHGEPADIEEVPNRPESALKKEGYDHIFFTFTSSSYSEFFKVISKKKCALFCKSIPQLVMQIISCADWCYQNEPDKSKFFDGCKIQQPAKISGATITLTKVPDNAAQAPRIKSTGD